MAVHHNVDFVLAEDTEVSPCCHRARRSEQDITDIGAEHGPTPPVSDGAS